MSLLDCLIDREARDEDPALVLRFEHRVAALSKKLETEGAKPHLMERLRLERKVYFALLELVTETKR